MFNGGYMGNSMVGVGQNLLGVEEKSIEVDVNLLFCYMNYGGP